MFADITNYRNTSDWYFIGVAAIVVDLVVILMTRYAGTNPSFKVQALSEWYDRFGFAAALSDILSALIGIAAARYIYTAAGFKGVLAFVACIILFQLFHDIFFYVAVIKPMKKGENQMIDVFKSYAEENGGKILVADALILLSTAGIGAALKGLPFHYTVGTGLVTTYALTYVLYTKAT
jgi:hypothetical protein